MSIENGVPQIELPTDYPNDMILRMQNEDFLNKTRGLSSIAIPSFGIQKAALRAVAQESVGSPAVTSALTTGADIYMTTVGVITNPIPYCSDSAYATALRGAVEFGRFVATDDQKMVEKLREADGRMFADAPFLAEVIDEVTERYYPHNKGLHDLARYGAAAMRGMHILVNKRILADGRAAV